MYVAHCSCCNKQQTPRVQQYTGRMMMPCAHRQFDVRLHRTTPRPGTQIRALDEEAALEVLGLVASEKRDPKCTNKWQSHDDCCPSKSMYRSIYYLVRTTTNCCCSN